MRWQIECEGPFTQHPEDVAEPWDEQRYAGLHSPFTTPDGGIRILCMSNTCVANAHRHRRGLPTVANLVLTYAGVDTRTEPTSRWVIPMLLARPSRHRSTQKRLLERDARDQAPEPLPADVRCHRCGRRGRVLTATQLPSDAIVDF